MDSSPVFKLIFDKTAEENDTIWQTEADCEIDCVIANSLQDLSSH